MPKKAVCVGINKYPIKDADLRGCVNDANAWASLLTEHYDFPTGDITMITDEGAVKKTVLKALEDLVTGSQEGDVLVFTNSSHGSYIPDTDGDEPNGYDEVLCTYDIEDSPIIDDELRELFLNVPKGVSLTVISDSCHSGNVTRVAVSEILPGLGPNDDRRVRFLPPPFWRSSEKPISATLIPDATDAKPTKRETFPQSSMNHVLLSGCMDVEVSYDAMIEGAFHGAMTFHALKVIREANYEITYNDLAARLLPQVLDAGFPQHPQLEGHSDLKSKQIFT